MRNLLIAAGLVLVTTASAQAASPFANPFEKHPFMLIENDRYYDKVDPIYDVYVHGYTRDNGTYVAPYHRSSPDSNPYNNYGYGQ